MLFLPSSHSAKACVEICKQADKQASSPKVKEFAAQLAQDHQKCCDKLNEAIKSRNISASTPSTDAKNEMERLMKLQGTEFDRAYLAYVIKGHREGIAMFENESKNGKNAEVRTFADESLPMLREHLKKAEELQKSIN